MNSMNYVISIWKMEYHAIIKIQHLIRKKYFPLRGQKWSILITEHRIIPLVWQPLNTFIYVYIQQIFTLCLIKYYVPDVCTDKENRLRLINIKELIVKINMKL